MKIVWILVILIIIGVAVFAIRKKIGDTGERKQDKSSNLGASDKETIKTQVAPELQKTFDEKLLDAYSGKVTPEQLQGIRSDTNLTTEEKDKVEFEVLMSRFWPERIKARAYGKLNQSLKPVIYHKAYARTPARTELVEDKWIQVNDANFSYQTHQTNIFPTPIDALFVRKSQDHLFYPNSQFMSDNNRLWEMFNAYEWVSEDLRVKVVLADNSL